MKSDLHKATIRLMREEPKKTNCLQAAVISAICGGVMAALFIYVGFGGWL